MALYTADVMDVARQVKGNKKNDEVVGGAIREKKPRTEAQIAAGKKAAETRRLKKEAVSEEVKEVKEIVEVVKEKKPRSEAQIAATKKAAETRRLKKEAALKEIEDLKNEISVNEQLLEKEVKAKARKDKRKAEVQEKTPSLSSNDIIDEVIEKTIKKPRKENAERRKPVLVGNDNPPAWFEKYVQGVKQTENLASTDKQKNKEVNENAKVVASEKWGDEHTRDKVNQEVDKHMKRMYSMMFGR